MGDEKLGVSSSIWILKIKKHFLFSIRALGVAILDPQLHVHGQVLSQVSAQHESGSSGGLAYEWILLNE